MSRFDGLDPPSRDVLFELLAEARAAGAAVIVSTHRPDVIAAASRCVGIRDGQLAYDGAPDAEALAEFFDGLAVVTHHVVPTRRAELRAACGQGSRVIS